MSNIELWASTVSLTAPDNVQLLKPLTGGYQSTCGEPFTPQSLDYFLQNNSQCLIDFKAEYDAFIADFPNRFYAETVDLDRTSSDAVGDITVPANGMWYVMVHCITGENGNGGGTDQISLVPNSTGLATVQSDSGHASYAGSVSGGTVFTAQVNNTSQDDGRLTLFGVRYL